MISAQVKVLPGYHWESVEPQIRSALLDAFSFNNRGLAQDVVLSNVVRTIQQIEGVDYVDVDTLDALGEQQLQRDVASCRAEAEI